MKFLIAYIAAILLWCTTTVAQEQDTLRLGLFELTALAKEQSLMAKSATVQRRNADWEWQLFRSEIKPKLTADISALNFQRGVEGVSQQDGSINYLNVSKNTSNVALQVRQLLPLTGGSFFVRTKLERFDNFSTSSKIYGGAPLELGYEQNFFAFNSYKWKRRLAPVQYEEAKRSFAANLEKVALKTVSLYFALSLSQINQEIAQTNLLTNQTVLSIAKKKFGMGKISKDEFLQAKVQCKSAEIVALRTRVENKEAMNALKTHLAIKKTIQFRLQLPEVLPLPTLSFGDVWSRCQQNSAEWIQQQRRVLEMMQAEAQVHGQTGISGFLSASLGYATQAENFDNLPNNTNGLQMVGLRFSIPLVDWGETKAKRKRIEAKRKLVEQNIEQEKVDFEQQIYALVMAYNLLKEQAALAKQEKEMAKERFTIARGRYLAGDIKLIDLNLAMTQKDQSNRGYVNILQNFWTAHYQIRMLSLYDFQENTLILN